MKVSGSGSGGGGKPRLGLRLGPRIRTILNRDARSWVITPYSTCP